MPVHKLQHMPKHVSFRGPSSRSVWKVVLTLIALCVSGVIMIVTVSGAIEAKESSLIFSSENAPKPGSDAWKEIFPNGSSDCILIFGCGLRDDGTPTDMLRDRLLVGIELYFSGAAPKLLLSGDHGREAYDEVGAMKKFAVEKGVPEEDIFLDHSGFSTYESVYRAKHIFGVKSAVLVTQEYHLPRALYIAEKIGISTVGVSASLEEYRGQTYRSLREAAARFKDFFQVLLSISPEGAGNPALPVDIKGDGRVTAG